MSEVIAVIQGVAGVVAVDVDKLYRGVTATLQPRCSPISPTSTRTACSRPPSSWTLDPGPLSLEVMLRASTRAALRTASRRSTGSATSGRAARYAISWPSWPSRSSSSKKSRSALRRPVHRDLRRVGGSVHRRADRLPLTARRGAAHQQPAGGSRPHHCLPPPQTASMLEQLARDVTGWDANVVEYFLRIGTTQFMNHIRPQHAYEPDLRPGEVVPPAMAPFIPSQHSYAVDLREMETLERVGGPFDDIAHTVDVRRIQTGQGRYNIPNIGIFLWRLNDFSLTESPAVRVDDRRYFFSPLGNNAPLFTRPQPGAGDQSPRPAHQRSRADQPAHPGCPPRRLLRSGARHSHQPRRHRSGEPGCGRLRPLRRRRRNLAHRSQDKTAIDPVLGRIAFPENQDPPDTVLVTFAYGFAQAMGGGEYDRTAPHARSRACSRSAEAPPSSPRSTPCRRRRRRDQGQWPLQRDTLDRSRRRGHDRAACPGRESSRHPARRGAAHRGRRRQRGDPQRLADCRRPTPRPGQRRQPVAETQPAPLHPGAGTQPDDRWRPGARGEPSLVVDQPGVEVEIDHCIVGGVHVVPGASACITNSIVDATSQIGVAYAAPHDRPRRSPRPADCCARSTRRSSVRCGLFRWSTPPTSSFWATSCPSGANPAACDSPSSISRRPCHVASAASRTRNRGAHRRPGTERPAPDRRPAGRDRGRRRPLARAALDLDPLRRPRLRAAPYQLPAADSRRRG